MDQSLNQKLKAGALALALVMMMSACSSSKVEDGASPAETVAAADQAAEATTDAVPAADPASADLSDPNAGPIADDPSLAQQPAPDALASTGDQPPMSDPGAAMGDAPAGDPSMAVADPNAMPADLPVSDPNLATDPNVSDSGIATAPAPDAGTDAMADSGSSLDLPSTDDSLAMDPAPVTESDQNYLADAEPTEPVVTPTKKHKKKKKKSVRGHTASWASQSSGDASHYVVKRGDTLMKIAFENYGDLYRWREIYEANRDRIQDPNHVPPGTELVLNGAGMVQIDRNGEQYLIRRGDTLGSISNTVYGTTRKWKKLWENNRQLIKDPNKIYAGFYLYYQPEGRMMTNGDDSMGSPSAMNQPQTTGQQQAAQVLNQAKPVQAQVATQSVHTAPAMQPNPPVQQMPSQPTQMPRSPASVPTTTH